MPTNADVQPFRQVSEPQPRSVRRGHVLLAACLGVFASFASLFIYTFGVFLKPVSAEFGWSRAQTSSGFLGAVLAVAFCSPLLGRLLDRLPARRIVIPCMIIYACCFASLALLTPHLWHFIGVLTLMGMVGNGTTQLAYARVVSAWFDASRGRALAAVMAGSGVGSAIFPSLAQALISSFGWRWAYAILGIGVLAVGLPTTIAFLYEPARTTTSQKAPDAAVPTRNSLRADLFSTPFLGIIAALLLFSLATNGLNTHWVALLTDRGFSAAHAAAVVSAAGFAALASKLATGFLLDRFRANTVVSALLVFCAVGVAASAYAQSNRVAFAAAVLVGMGMGAESDAVPFLLTRYFGLRRFSELYGYTWMAYAIAGGTGPILAGAAFDSTHSYQRTLLLFSGMVAAAALLFAALPRYGRIGPDPGN